MGRHTEDIIFSLLQGINKKDLQQQQVKVEQHVKNAASHQHPDCIRVDEGWWDLGKMEELIEQHREREPEPGIELLL